LITTWGSSYFSRTFSEHRVDLASIETLRPRIRSRVEGEAIRVA
jgi:hypothetical protein